MGSHYFTSATSCGLLLNNLCCAVFIIITAFEFINNNWSVGRGSSVGTASRYGPDGPGIEFRWSLDFPHPSKPALGLIQPRVK
jgi:hypothetical protein